MSENKPDRLTDITTLVKRIQDMKQREAAASRALDAARKAIRERGQFVPKRVAPIQRSDFSF